MKTLNCLLLFASLWLCVAASAQSFPSKIALRTGPQITSSRLSAAAVERINVRLEKRNAEPILVILKCAAAPTIKAALMQQGIQLLEYISSGAFTALVYKKQSAAILKNLGVHAIVAPAPKQKISSGLWAKGMAAGSSPISVWIKIPTAVTPDAAQKALKSFGAATPVYPGVYRVMLSRYKLDAIAAHPLVAYVQEAPPPPQSLVQESRVAAGANMLQGSGASGGRGLNGEGVAIGIGDNGDVQTHFDFSGRLINRSYSGVGDHASLTHGIAAGSGAIEERNTGFAPKATIISSDFTNILVNAGRYVQDYNMVVTNNSYGNVIDCNSNGLYDMTSAYLDEQALLLPSLQHVFSSGNSGGTTCAPAALGFGTVLGSFQAAKNVLTVGSTNAAGAIAYHSSKGPVKDGRLKPEVVALGDGLSAPWPENNYYYAYGTSLASPGVAGGMALLYQRYRQLYSADPQSALMKALICNGASDRGNAGPDYQYGFGWMNLVRSIDMLDSGRFFGGSLAQGAQQTHSIQVPAGTAQLKVMLYWHDPAPSLMSSQALVHDLDLTVNRVGQMHLPLVLNPAAVNSIAVPGADHLNNIEQVVINNPAAGTYDLVVAGTAIAALPQQSYVVVYDAVPAVVQLLSPAGGDTYDTSETVRIHWETGGAITGTVSLQFSASDGTTWQSIASGIAAGTHFYNWKLPNSAAEKIRIKLVTDASGRESISGPFVLLPMPKNFTATAACEGYLALKWNSVAAATDYEILLQKGGDWESTLTTDTSFTFNSLFKDSAYLVTVRARRNGQAGRRCTGLIRTPSGGACAGTISNGDLKLDAILSPVSGRQATGSALGTAQPVSVRVKNLDDAPVAGFWVRYSINGGQSWVSEEVTTPLAAGATYMHHFVQKPDLSAAGDYDFIALVQNKAADASLKNDTLRSTVRHLPNAPLNLTTPYSENFESLSSTIATQQAVTGLRGLDRFDFNPGSANGRLRSFVNTGMAYSGAHALTMDADRNLASPTKTYLTATFNIAHYNAATTELRLDFRYKTHGATNAANRLWLRGNDAQPWIEAYRFGPAPGATVAYESAAGIDLSEALLQASQATSASFQLRWEQEGGMPAVSEDLAAGYSIDDLRLYTVGNDVQLLATDSMGHTRCSMGTAEPLGIGLRNGTRNAVHNLPVKYSVNGGAWVTETIPFLGGKDTLYYSFAQKPDLSAPGTYHIVFATALPADEVRGNDTLEVMVHHLGTIAAFPYLQNFESGAGGWVTGGFNSSWQLGTPAAAKMIRAASGTKAWKTGLAGNYNDYEQSYLYSPCLQVGALQNPALSFQVALDFEQCASPCDSVWVEYSADGATWQKLSGAGINWYGAGGSWRPAGDTRWHVATVALPKNMPSLRLRFAFFSDGSVGAEGIAVDDIHVYDNSMGIYAGPTMDTAVKQTIGGSEGWMHFTASGRLVASVHGAGQAMGETAVQAFVHTGAMRYSLDQYYAARNLVVLPAVKSFADSVRVRFYFTEAEVAQMMGAATCASCVPPASVTDLGISQYSDADTAKENGTIGDNVAGTWQFTTPQHARLVPFDIGYYLEFGVKSFSEFWLSAGALGNNQPLAVTFINLKAKKISENVAQLTWQVASEAALDYYEIQAASGPEALAGGRFEALGKVAAQGKTQYAYTDETGSKSGTRYYRLRMVNTNGSFVFSPVASVQFGPLAAWQLYPNPSATIFNLLYQLEAGATAGLQLTDAIGRRLKHIPLKGGSAQVISIDLSGPKYTPGVYLLHGEGRMFKLYKQ